MPFCVNLFDFVILRHLRIDKSYRHPDMTLNFVTLWVDRNNGHNAINHAFSKVSPKIE